MLKRTTKAAVHKVKKWIVNFHSSVTGRYIKPEDAKANPRESFKERKERKRRRPY